MNKAINKMENNNSIPQHAVNDAINEMIKNMAFDDDKKERLKDKEPERYFINNGLEIKVSATRPMRAANMIYSTMIKEDKANKDETTVFVFYEEKEDGSKKLHKYSGKRQKLEESVKQVSSNKTVSGVYTNKIEKII